MSYNGEPKVVQLRREAHDLRQARSRDGWIEGQISRAVAISANLWPSSDTGTVRSLLLESVAEWRHAHEPRWASREECAAHEAGHYIALEAVGFGATDAEIHGRPFGRGGWGGSAGSWELPLEEGMRERACITIKSVTSEALRTFSGPAAQAMVKGDAYCSPGEFIIFCLCAAWIASKTNYNQKEVIFHLIESTARLINGHRRSIENIADRLVRGRRVAYFKRPVAKILAPVCKLPLASLPDPPPSEVLELLRLVANAPIDLGALTRKMREADR